MAEEAKYQHGQQGRVVAWPMRRTCTMIRARILHWYYFKYNRYNGAPSPEMEDLGEDQQSRDVDDEEVDDEECTEDNIDVMDQGLHTVE